MRKLLVLAIDAASPALLRSWAGDGTLPNIARLMASGLVGETQSDAGLYVGSTWPSFYTGVNPGGHGFYWLEQLRCGTYRTVPASAETFARRKPFWEILAEAGRRPLVFDIPLSRVAPDLDGVQVGEWRPHDLVFGFETTPRALKHEILRLDDADPATSSCDVSHRSLLEYVEFADRLAQSAATRGRIGARLLAGQRWDVAMMVFSEAHCAGHQLWHFHDPEHPAFAAASDPGDLLRRIYAAIDAAVGAIVASLEPGTTIVVLTLHGMSYMAGASSILPDILQRLGVASPPTSQPPSGVRSMRQRVVQHLKRAYHRVPERIRRPIWDARARVDKHWLGRGLPMRIDPERSRCFAVETGPIVGGIRLNLRGREPAGTLTAGPEVDAFCEQLTRELLAITDPDSGRKLVQAVLRTADLFRGAFGDELPDLLVEWNLERPLGTTVAGTGAGALLRAHSPAIGLIETINALSRTGEHRSGGMFIAIGPAIPCGALGRIVSTLDLAPTFVRMMDVEMPAVDGRVIPELLGT